MSDDAIPIAYSAVEAGTPVLTADGDQFGKVESVLIVEEVDVFDGIVVDTPDGWRFVDADRVGTLTTAAVWTKLTSAEVDQLPAPSGSPAYGVDASDDTGNSIADRFGRMFGRGKWSQEK